MAKKVVRKAGKAKASKASTAVRPQVRPLLERSAAATRAAKAAKATKRGNAGKYVYQFVTKTDGNGTMKPLLGGKGANLAEMCRIGLPVPPGFTITTEVCTYYYDHKRTYPAALRAQMEAGIL